ERDADRVGAGEQRAGLRALLARGAHQQRGLVRELPRAGERDAADVEGGEPADGVVPVVPLGPGAIPGAGGAGVQHGLPAAAGPGPGRPGAGGGARDRHLPDHAVLDVSLLMSGGSMEASRGNHGGGQGYWRSLEEWAGSPEFRAQVEREFPALAGEWDEGLSRRDFLRVMAAPLALAGIGPMAGCPSPREQI